MGFWGGLVAGVVSTVAVGALVLFGYSVWLTFRGLR